MYTGTGTTFITSTYYFKLNFVVCSSSPKSTCQQILMLKQNMYITIWTAAFVCIYNVWIKFLIDSNLFEEEYTTKWRNMYKMNVAQGEKSSLRTFVKMYIQIEWNTSQRCVVNPRPRYLITNVSENMAQLGIEWINKLMYAIKKKKKSSSTELIEAFSNCKIRFSCFTRTE